MTDIRYRTCKVPGCYPAALPCAQDEEPARPSTATNPGSNTASKAWHERKHSRPEQAANRDHQRRDTGSPSHQARESAPRCFAANAGAGRQAGRRYGRLTGAARATLGYDGRGPEAESLLGP